MLRNDTPHELPPGIVAWVWEVWGYTDARDGDPSDFEGCTDPDPAALSYLRGYARGTMP